MARKPSAARSAYRDLGNMCCDLTAETVERDLVFVGLTGMYDARPEGKDRVAKCQAPAFVL